MTQPITLLGLESSCDDTAAAVVRGHVGAAEVLSSVVYGQGDLHAAFGGVVPEIAARAHAERMDLAVEQALTQASLGLADVDAVAVTAGPGLIGGVVSGVMCAKGLAAARGLPLIGVNHLAGHALTPRLTDALPYPYLKLLVSCGHCNSLISSTVDECPWCGVAEKRRPRRPLRKRWSLGALITITTLLGLLLWLMTLYRRKITTERDAYFIRYGRNSRWQWPVDSGLIAKPGTLSREFRSGSSIATFASMSES